MTEHSGRGDPATTIELLWGTREPSRRGPKPALTVEQVVGAAIGIADTHGLDGLSMRQVADRLGVGTMSLYRYVPGKGELIDLMVDRVSAETERPPFGRTRWRKRLEGVATENRRLFDRHPWLAHVFPGRPALGPNVIAKWDYELSTIDGIGLSDVEMDSVLTLVLEYVRSTVLAMHEMGRIVESSGMSDQEWWGAVAPALAKVHRPEDHPVAVRVGSAAGEAYQGAYDWEHAFGFGLARILDGVEAFVDRDRR